MDIKAFTESIRGLVPSEYQWKFSLYSTSKSSDGLELNFGLCAMQGISVWAEVIKNHLLEKVASSRLVAEYSPLLEKEVIGAVAETDELIKEPLSTILTDLQNALEYPSEDFVNGTMPRTAGYAFYGERTDEESGELKKVLFMRRSNPFLQGAKTLLCTVQGEALAQSVSPVLKFAAPVDFLFIDGVCYFLSTGIEKDFELENRNAAICAKRMELIAESGVIGNYDMLESEAMSAKNARKFIDFDNAILKHIVSLEIMDRIDFLSTYGIILDNEGRIETSDAEQCELLIDLLCCRSCLDAFGRLAVGSKITPRG
ncbi:MAG: hypothetical protein LBS74_10615 [Oscillospiraceae bacterium]|nr:hypothetical protein [Oscillospiraceae bacterium]